MPYVPDLDVMLTAGYRAEHDGSEYVVQPYELGLLVLPTGKVVGCDPLIAHTTPFTDAVPPGQYPLRAWVAELRGDGRPWQRRIAALQLIILAEPTVSWSMALLSDQDAVSLGEEGFFGYRVGSGTGTLADQIAITALSEWDYDEVEEVFIPAQIPDDPIEAVIAAVVDKRTGANVYVVGAGWGDGVYATYLGRTGDGRIASFVTDFRVVPHG